MALFTIKIKNKNKKPGGPGPPNNQALHYSIYKTDSLDLKENAQEFIQTNERRQAFFGKYN